MTVTAAIVPVTVKDAPHLRRADESPFEHQLFLMWWTAVPRPAVPPEYDALSHDKQWRQRANVLDHHLRDEATDLMRVVNRMCRNSLKVCDRGMMHYAEQADLDPGKHSLSDVTALAKMIIGQALEQAQAAPKDVEYDFTGCTREEAMVLMAADEIRARYAVEPGR